MSLSQLRFGLVTACELLAEGSARKALVWLGSAPELVYGILGGGQALGRKNVYDSVIKADGAASAIVVLGQSLNPDGTPPLSLLRRADLAANLFRDEAMAAEKAGRPWPLVIPTGGDPVRVGVTEAELMAQQLHMRGVPEEAVVLEPKALNTLQNAWEVIPLLPAGCKRLLLVSSDFHIPRATYLFEAVFAHRGITMTIEPHSAESGCPANEMGLGSNSSSSVSDINAQPLIVRARNEERFIRDEVVQIGLKQHVPGVEVPPLPSERLHEALRQVRNLIHTNA